jgi:hypothetical protein
MSDVVSLDSCLPGVGRALYCSWGIGIAGVAGIVYRPEERYCKCGVDLEKGQER